MSRASYCARLTGNGAGRQFHCPVQGRQTIASPPFRIQIIAGGRRRSEMTALMISAPERSFAAQAESRQAGTRASSRTGTQRNMQRFAIIPSRAPQWG